MNMNLIITGFITLVLLSGVQAQQVNNLAFPEGTVLNSTGDFGYVKKAGHGEIKMLLIADIGFSWEIYADFMNSNEKRYTMYAITLPGSGGTPPLPMPDENVSYSKRTGLEMLQKAVINLIDKEKMNRPVIAGNLIIASWLALNTALNYPDKVSKLIILGGMPFATWPSPKDPSGKTPVSMNERASNVDFYSAPRIFKPMTRETWLKNLFQPYQYANDTLMASALYQKSSTVLIPTMARLLCEFYTTDASERFADIKIPVLVVMPGFNDLYFSQHPYSTDKKYFWDEWKTATTNPNFEIKKIPDARLFVWVDQPDTVNRLIRAFIK
jgi:pimeloyl-ACP methyl ester carboxylesterase